MQVGLLVWRGTAWGRWRRFSAGSCLAVSQQSRCFSSYHILLENVPPWPLFSYCFQRLQRVLCISFCPLSVINSSKLNAITRKGAFMVCSNPLHNQFLFWLCGSKVSMCLRHPRSNWVVLLITSQCKSGFFCLLGPIDWHVGHGEAFKELELMKTLHGICKPFVKTLRGWMLN